MSNIEEFLKVLKVPVMFKSLVEASIKNLGYPIKMRDEITKKMRGAISPDHLSEVLRNIYSNHFTEEEIDNMIEFYKSPTGQKCLDKMPVVAQEINAGITQIIISNLGLT